MPPPDLDEGSEYPEQDVFAQVLARWSKGQITYDRWMDESLDKAFQLADGIIHESEVKAEEMRKLKAKSGRRR